MAQAPLQPAVLLYDGRCSVCDGTARAIERMDPDRRRVHAVDFRASTRESDAAGIPAESLEAGIHLIHPDGAVSAGPDAVRDALRALRLGGVAWTLALPVAGTLFERFYDWFARNRLRWFERRSPEAGSACEDGGCRMDGGSDEASVP
ncbi:MAG: DUF393 domain-containing protein [Planctomycetota bacterium]